MYFKLKRPAKLKFHRGGAKLIWNWGGRKIDLKLMRQKCISYWGGSKIDLKLWGANLYNIEGPQIILKLRGRKMYILGWSCNIRIGMYYMVLESSEWYKIWPSLGYKLTSTVHRKMYMGLHKQTLYSPTRLYLCLLQSQNVLILFLS